MTHLSKTASGKFIIAKIRNNNGKKLYTTETFNQKPSAIKNMIAVLKDDENMFMRFQDNTGEKPIIKTLSVDGSITNTVLKPFKPYVPKKSSKK